MREIKFRAWDKRHNSMELIDDLYWFEEQMVHSFKDGNTMSGDYEFMQYTGLKDKNGKEIYEGDIVVHKWRAENGRHESTVVIGTDPIFIDCGYLAEQDDYDETTNEVIGNIHENRELLK